MKALLRILALWRGRALWLAAGVVISLAALGTAVGLMTASAALVTGIITGTALATPLVLRVLGPARVVLRYLERVVTHDAMFRALADLRVWFFRGLSQRAAGGLGFRRAGDVLARLVNDVEALDGLYLRILVPACGAVVLLPVLVWVIGRIDTGLAVLVALLFALSAFALPLLTARGAAALGERLSSTTANLRVMALDTLTGLREVRAFGMEGRMLAEVQSREAAMLATQHEAARRAAIAGVGSFLCAQAAILVVLLKAGEHPAAAATLAFLTVAAFEAVSGLPRAGALAGHASAAAARVLDAAAGKVALPDPATPAALPVSSALRFDAVRFRWQPDRPDVFDGLTLDIPQNSRVALLGPSGAGKSTLAALALKVVAPQRGRVKLGGVDLATLSAQDVRSRIGWLSQATHLFDDSIRANLLLARPEATEADLWAALDAARIGDVVRSLPDGLDAWVGESGTRFSGGQGRRLALARALLSRAPVLILDEPCAGLDADTERDFFETLNATADDRTIILIAHRLTGAERLDRIWRLSSGRAVAAAA
jgi:ATP-binding cassette, subfamily C, bacterial CydC